MTALITTKDKSQTNKHFWEQQTTTAKASRIWNLWTDVNTWKQWDTGLENATMEETFKLNAKGVITSLEGRKSKFRVIEYVEGKCYTIKTNLPLGSLNVRRSLERVGDRTLFKHEVWFSGLSGSLFAKIFGAKFRLMLPEVLKNIKKIAEA